MTKKKPFFPDKERSFFQCVDPAQIDEDRLRERCSALGFKLFLIDASNIRSESELMSKFADIMSFPAYFGKNWDALLDLATDLSWHNYLGYMLVVRNPEHLAHAGPQTLGTFLAVCKSIVRRWQARSDEGDHLRRIFQCVLVTTSDLCS